MKNLIIGLALSVVGAMLIAAGAICLAILNGATDGYPLLIIIGAICLIAAIVCFFMSDETKK